MDDDDEEEEEENWRIGGGSYRVGSADGEVKAASMHVGRRRREDDGWLYFKGAGADSFPPRDDDVEPVRSLPHRSSQPPHHPHALLHLPRLMLRGEEGVHVLVAVSRGGRRWRREAGKEHGRGGRGVTCGLSR
eukprot:762019-Hanusia_phi.AAC.2